MTIRLPRREAPDAAEIAPLLPGGRIDMSVKVERRGDLLAMPRASLGIAARPGEMKGDDIKHDGRSSLLPLGCPCHDQSRIFLGASGLIWRKDVPAGPAEILSRTGG